MKILTMPQIDMSQCPFVLPPPSLSNCGGHRSPIDGKPMYSLIDLTVCGLTALHNGEQSITDLSKWFIENDFRVAELWVYISILIKDVHTHSIAEWKIYANNNDRLMKLFKNNAPFTFR